MDYYAKFDQSRSNVMGIRRQFPKIGSAGARTLGVMAWVVPKKTVSPHVLLNLIT